MANKNYKRGVEIERRIIQQLEEVGYKASRTAGSHGIYDVIAENGLGIRLIQAKRVKKGSSYKAEYKEAKEKMSAMPKLPSVSREIWVWEDYEGWVVQDIV